MDSLKGATKQHIEMQKVLLKVLVYIVVDYLSDNSLEIVGMCSLCINEQMQVGMSRPMAGNRKPAETKDTGRSIS